jgi:DNA (cytosine-5)-methyltransferase 1
VLAGFRKDLGVHEGFTLADIRKTYPVMKPKLGDILDAEVDSRYILPARLWEHFLDRSVRFRAGGGGPGYGLVGPEDVTRPLSGHYSKDGADILVAPRFDPEQGTALSEARPRRLTPRECARLMGFDGPGESRFRIPVSDTRAYRLFGTASVVPVFAAVAQLMKERIVAGRNLSATARSEWLFPVG